MQFPLIQFDRALRYQSYDKWDREYVDQLDKLAERSPWRATYHIEPQTGLLNDPNGFSYYNGQFHLFYQLFPYGPVHGLKGWNHLTSNDLIHWQDHGIKLLPDSIQDSHGAYSGSALEVDNQLFIIYTGNTRDDNWVRHPLQNAAFMNEAGELIKVATPLIRQHSQVTDHFRDPQIFRHLGFYWCIIGGQRAIDQQGVIYLYKAKEQDVLDWELVREWQLEGDNSSYMIECPNIVFINQQPVLIFCPQGISKDTFAYDNIFPNAYVISQAFEDDQLQGQGAMRNLDFGFDVYATQAFNSPDGRVLAVSWLGLPDIDSPTERYGYQGALSLVKELTIKEGKLYQYPTNEAQMLRKSVMTVEEYNHIGHNHFELELTVQAGDQVSVWLLADEGRSHFVKLTIDAKNGKVILDRSQMGITYAQSYGHMRQTDLKDNESITINVFLDESILEVFINKGEKVMSSRVFAQSIEQTYLYTSKSVQGQLWSLEL